MESGKSKPCRHRRISPVRLAGKAKRPTAEQSEGVDVFALLCAREGLPTPTPEYRFHPVRRWRIDYYFEQGAVKVALEVEGAVWAHGRHTRGSGFVKDLEKYNEISRSGMYLVRVQPKQLCSDYTINLLKDILCRQT